MKTGLTDTTPDAEQVWIDLLRKAGATQRLAKTFSLTQSTISRAKRAIKRANPELSPQEANILFLSNNFGKDLAQKVKTYLTRFQNE